MKAPDNISNTSNANTKSFLLGVMAIMPLTIAVVPWGILAGSIAVEADLDIWQSQAMSLIIYAGAAQLAAIGMLKAGLGLGSIIVTTLLITSRHLLYSMTMRSSMSHLPFRWRAGLAFLLTDELFAIANPNVKPHFDRWHALGGGLSFYLAWNLAALAGVIAGNTVEGIEHWGLEFAIAATFIAIIVPSIKNPSTLICVLVSLVSAVSCQLLAIEGGLLISALTGMVTGFSYAKFSGEQTGE